VFCFLIGFCAFNAGPVGGQIFRQKAAEDKALVSSQLEAERKRDPPPVGDKSVLFSSPSSRMVGQKS
jgi:hypothetical protein